MSSHGNYGYSNPKWQWGKHNLQPQKNNKVFTTPEVLMVDGGSILTTRSL